MIRSTIERTANISHDGKYRYELTRIWNRKLPILVIMMLNPSTADGRKDDPTIRRCMAFAESWGYGGIKIVNVYAYRSQSPKELWKVEDPHGTWNMMFVEEAFRKATHPPVVAWGTKARPEHVRAFATKSWFGTPRCLGTTNGGHPRHPLYLRADTQLVDWTWK